MWDEVCPKACPPPPQKWKVSDKYIDAFYYCGLSLVEIANSFGVTHKAVEDALKRFDKEAYMSERAMRKEENNHRRRQKDRERKRMPCARQKDRERKHTPEARQKDRERKHAPEVREKDRERKRLEREEEGLYVEAVRKALRDEAVVVLLRRAARELKTRLPNEQWEKQWVCTRYIPEVPAMQHPCPGQAKEEVELITPGEAAGRAGYEFRLLRGKMVGVPGPTLLQIRPVLEQGDMRAAFQLASKAILEAGFINPLARVEDVENGLARTYAPQELAALRTTLIDSARAMARVTDPPPLPDLPKEEKRKVVSRWLAQSRAAVRESWAGATYGTGKRGKEGGIKSASRGVAMSARTRS